MRFAFTKLALALGLVLLLAGTSWAAGGTYISVFGGATWLNKVEEDINADLDFDTGYHAGLAVGTRIGSLEGAEFRAELEVAYRENEPEFADDLGGRGVNIELHGHVKAYSLMVNTYLDFPNDTFCTPYLGAGLGAARVDYRLKTIGRATVDDHDNVAAYQLMAGFNFALTERVSLDTEYRYFATDDPDIRDEFGTKGDLEYDSHNAKVGLRYDF